MNLAPSSHEAVLSARRRGEYRSLARSKGRRELGQYLIEGIRGVEAAVLGSAELVDLVATTAALENPRVARLAARAGGRVLRASERDLEAIGDARTSQGIVAAARIPTWDHPPPGPPWLILDGVQDPGNVGTLIRTAAWFGVAAVICGPVTADPYQPKVVRSSQGGLWDLEVRRVRDWSVLEVDAPVYVADMDGMPAASWAPPRASVLVIGSEAHGPSPEVRAAASARVSILRSGNGATESLNASVAGGILLDRWLGGPGHPGP